MVNYNITMPDDPFAKHADGLIVESVTQKCGSQFGQAATSQQQVQAELAAQPANVNPANAPAQPSGIQSPEGFNDVAERIGHDVQTAQVPPVQTGSVLSEGLGMACNAMSAKLNTPEINQIVSPDPTNSNPDLNRAPEMLQPDEVIHTHRANLDLTNNSGPSMGGMSM